jgi:hypothetical protein
VKKYIKDLPITAIDAEACDQVSSTMYIEAFWRWTLQNITPASIPLVDGTQDYSVPTNLYRMWRARIVRTDTTPDQYNEIGVKEFLPPDLNPASPWIMRAMCHEESLGKLRLEQAASISTGETYELQGEYQLNPTKITSLTLGDPFWFPDVYFPVFCEGLKWKLFEYADDARAGTVTIDRHGNRQTTGQAGKFYFALDMMKQAEDFGSGDSSEFPDEPFGVSSFNGMGSIYGAF